jgi:hypothetical protein
MELWDLHHIRRLDDRGFVDALYGQRRGASDAGDAAHRQDHGRHDHAASPAAATVADLEGVASTACDDDCSTKP